MANEESMNNFTPRAQQVLALARKEADRFNHNFVGTEHLLLGLIKLGQGVAVNVLQNVPGAAFDNTLDPTTGTDPNFRTPAEPSIAVGINRIVEIVNNTVFVLDKSGALTKEVFGPVLHIVKWKAKELDKVIAEIAASGYGLTLGVHSRIEATIRKVVDALDTGNVYVNRNMIGAVVGTQPFGGSGLSGTGFKAGGPAYLQRFAQEQVISVNTAAAGGNASLMMIG